MGRKSKLSDVQWEQVGKRLLEGESGRALGREFGVAEATIRGRFAGQRGQINLGSLGATSLSPSPLRGPPSPAGGRGEPCAHFSQHSALHSVPNSAPDLAARLSSITEHLAFAAVYGAATAQRLSGIASAQADQMDAAPPEQATDALKRIAALTAAANNAAEIGVILLKAYKDVMDSMNKPEADEAGLLREIARLLPQ